MPSPIPAIAKRTDPPRQQQIQFMNVKAYDNDHQNTEEVGKVEQIEVLPPDLWHSSDRDEEHDDDSKQSGEWKRRSPHAKRCLVARPSFTIERKAWMTTRAKRVYADSMCKVKVVETDSRKNDARALCLDIGTSAMPMVTSHMWPVKAIAASRFPPLLIPPEALRSRK
ncbi:MAG: hypothetical protein Q9181_007655 [Wetmoreana brouardii]